MPAMSLRLEVEIFGHRIPFISSRHYLRWPELKEGEPPPPPADKWDTLALLLELHNDGTKRTVRRKVTSADIVRVETFYDRGDHAGDHDYLVAPGVVDELIRERCLEGTPGWGYTDENKLRLTDHGVEVLVRHLKTLPDKDSPAGK